MIKPPTPLRKRKRTEQIKDMVSLRYDHNMALQQIADKYGASYGSVSRAIFIFKKNNA